MLIINHGIGIERTELTLKSIADAAKDYKFKSLSNNELKRKKQIIDYFETKVKTGRIEFAERKV